MTNKKSNHKHMKTINFFYYSIFIASLFLTSCSKKSLEFDATGTFESTEIIVSSELSGKIISLNIEEGTELTQNQSIGVIDSVQLFLKKEQLLASQQAVNNRKPDIRKQLATIEQQIATAKTEKKRIQNLLASDAVNKKQLDDVNAQIELLEKQQAATKSTLESSYNSLTDEDKSVQMQIAQLEDQLKKCYIKSPIAGTVLTKYTEMGELTAPGKAIFKIADTKNFILRAYVTSNQLTTVKLGQQVKVYADLGAKDSKEYTGIVSWISPKAEFTPKTIQTRDERSNLVYAVKIAVKNDGFLKIGMYGNVKF